jgi:hypothetical protein
MTSRVQLFRNMAARAIGIVALIAMLGFYPSYLHALHTMCGIAKGKVVRFL